ncbi:MAG TPA: ROK family protein, partial [Chitinophagaceae bacterium]|nr:ROK family protein [Chitinophagaceae bacterium]
QTNAHAGADNMIAHLIDGIQSLLLKNSIDIQEVLGIGISCGGPLNSKQSIILSPPNLPGWDEVPVVKNFADKFNLPVSLQNDANACALAEWKFGAGKSFQNIIFLTFGTGMGAGLILNGKLYSGTNDMAGEAGHIRLSNTGPVGYGKAGSFEGFCSGSGIAQLAQMKAKEKLQAGEKVSFCKSIAGINEITALSVAEAAHNGDPLAKEIYQLSGTYLGKGIAVLIDILNPEVIIIGGIFERSGELLIPAMEKIIKEETLSLSRNVCRIVAAALGENIGDYAALSVAANNL